MRRTDKPLVWLHGPVRTPPFSESGRRQAGYLLRMLQRGEQLAMPFSRALRVVGPRCCELRINDQGRAWRIVYRVDADAIVILEVFDKKTRATPHNVIAACRDRLGRYDNA